MHDWIDLRDGYAARNKSACVDGMEIHYHKADHRSSLEHCQSAT